MLAFIYTKNKVVREEEIEEDDIFEVFDEKNIRITKPPDCLGLNPKRVNMDDTFEAPEYYKSIARIFFQIKKNRQ